LTVEKQDPRVRRVPPVLDRLAAPGFRRRCCPDRLSVRSAPRVRQSLLLPRDSSEQSGKAEVFVRQYPLLGTPPVRLSSNGGTGPLWRNSGSILYVEPGTGVMEVTIQAGRRLREPQRLFAADFLPRIEHLDSRLLSGARRAPLSDTAGRHAWRSGRPYRGGCELVSKTDRAFAATVRSVSRKGAQTQRKTKKGGFASLRLREIDLVFSNLYGALATRTQKRDDGRFPRRRAFHGRMCHFHPYHGW
jgi:hypothetical protein